MAKQTTHILLKFVSGPWEFEGNVLINKKFELEKEKSCWIVSFFLLKQCDTCIRVFFSQRKPCQLHQCKHDQVFLTSSYLSQIHVIHCFGYFIGRWTYEHYETRKIPTSTVNFSVYISGNTRSVSKLKLFHLLCVQIV